MIPKEDYFELINRLRIGGDFIAAKIIESLLEERNRLMDEIHGKCCYCAYYGKTPFENPCRFCEHTGYEFDCSDEWTWHGEEEESEGGDR